MSSKIAILVTGDRNAKSEVWSGIVDMALMNAVDYERVVIIHGAAKGIDTMAGGLGDVVKHYKSLPFPAQWNKYGKAAGPKRNAAMLRVLLEFKEHGYEVYVLAFHPNLNYSVGTRNMVEHTLNKTDVPVAYYTEEDGPIDLRVERNRKIWLSPRENRF